MDTFALIVGYVMLGSVSLAIILVALTFVIGALLKIVAKSKQIRFALIGYFISKKNYKAAEGNLKAYQDIINKELGKTVPQKIRAIEETVEEARTVNEVEIN